MLDIIDASEYSSEIKVLITCSLVILLDLAFLVFAYFRIKTKVEIIKKEDLTDERISKHNAECFGKRNLEEK